MDDCLNYIFDHIPFKELLSMCSVCQKWNTLIYEYLLPKDVTFYLDYQLFALKIRDEYVEFRGRFATEDIPKIYNKDNSHDTMKRGQICMELGYKNYRWFTYPKGVIAGFNTNYIFDKEIESATGDNKSVIVFVNDKYYYFGKKNI